MKKRTSGPKQRSADADVSPAPAPGFAQHVWWAAPFALFLVLRLFSSEPYYLLGGDQCTYLQLGRTFPKHQLFNHELYLLHPPALGYVIGLLHLAMPLLTAGLAATLLFACLNFFVVKKLAAFEGIPRMGVFAGLTYLALSRPGVAYDYHVTRVAPLVCATAFALLMFLRFLREPGAKTLLWSMGANVACLIISDQAMLLLPCEAVLLFSRRGLAAGWKRPAALGAVSVAAVAIWPLVRLAEYTKRADLPAGIDGTIEFTKNLPWKAILQPNFLPFTNAHRSLFTQTSLSLSNLDLRLLFGLPFDLLLVPAALSAIALIGLIAAALSRPESRKRSLEWLALALLFQLPVGLGMNEWYGMAFLVPFSLVVMEGAAAAIALLRAPEKAVAAGLAAACALAAVAWVGSSASGPSNLLMPRGGDHFLFARPPLTRGSAIAPFFAKMPRDTGIMAPQGLSPEIVYLTDKRVVALPFDPELLDVFIQKYRISYVVTSREYFGRYDKPALDLYTSRLVTERLFQHPEKYRPLHSAQENFPAFYPPQEYFIFQVQ